MKRNRICFCCVAMVLCLLFAGCAAENGPAATSEPQTITDKTTEATADSTVTEPEEDDMKGSTPLEELSENHSPKAAADEVMQSMIRISSDEMKGTHDAQYVFANGKAYVVYEANNEKAGDPGTYEKEYSALAIVVLRSFTVESIEKFAYGQQEYSNVKLLKGSAFVPRVIRKDENTLRFFFSNIAVSGSSGYIYYVDYDLNTESFDDSAYRLNIMTENGPVYFTAQIYAKLFRESGHACDDSTFGHFLFDIFDVGNTKYVALNNYRGAQNSLAKFNDSYDCIEIIGNIGGSYDSYRTTESGIMQLKDGTWMAILRNHVGDKNYLFSYSEDGTEWSEPKREEWVTNGTTSKPTLARFGDYYFMGWNELSRGLFHLAYSKDAKSWTTLYSFHSATTFQYPEFDMYDGQMYFSVTTGNKEQIYFGKLPIFEKDGRLYIEEASDDTAKLFGDISEYTLLSSKVRTNDSGTAWETYIKRDQKGVYFYGKTDGIMTDDKLFFMLDTDGNATALGASSSPHNMMFRFYGTLQVQSVYESGKRGYRSVAAFEGTEFFKEENADGTRVGLFLPYSAIAEIAPFAKDADQDSDLYVSAYGADASSGREYAAIIAGKGTSYKNPTTYAVFIASGEIQKR